MPEYVPQPYGMTVTCADCGARVDRKLTAAHDRWHADLEAARRTGS